MAKLRGNAVIGQSGGPTVVINESLVGAIREARKHPEIEHFLGALHGVKGILDEKFVDLGTLGDEVLDRVAGTPAAALGSVRKKPTEEEGGKIFEIFRRRNVRYFFYIGGNDSAETAHIINQLANQAGYEFHTVHIPKTIDNDLLENDHTPGFPSAAKFVALATMGDNCDNRSLPGIKVNVVMGRHAGFLTAATALARVRSDEGPHLVYLPEVPVTLDDFSGQVDEVYTRLGRCVVSVSEGIGRPDGRAWGEVLASECEKDSHGNVQLSGSGALGDFLTAEIRKRMDPKGARKLRIRADTFGYLQRSFPGIRSELDAREARAVGEFAVSMATSGDLDGSVALTRAQNLPYRHELTLVKLELVAKKTRRMPREWIREKGNQVTDAFLEYLRPLVGELPQLGWLR